MSNLKRVTNQTTSLPRSAVLVAWTRSWRLGLVSYDEVVEQVHGDDDEHLVGLPEEIAPVPLKHALARFSRLPEADIRLVLPSAGDPRGLPSPGAFTAAALETGEGALCGDIGLVPGISAHTSGSGQQWHSVLWQGHAITTGSARDPLTVPEADHDLLHAIHQATDALRALDVARFGPDVAAALSGLRRDNGHAELPPGYDPRADRLLARAAIVANLVSLAGRDGIGGAVNSFEAGARETALRPLATAARRARMAAINSPLVSA